MSQATDPGHAVKLEDAVEYKSLPSGLHTVEEDLVYFVHDEFAGVSAFANVPAAANDRNAHFFAVGVLVPLSLGRLGRGWRHVSKLKAFVGDIARQGDDFDKKDEIIEALSQYWNDNCLEQKPAVPAQQAQPESPLSFKHADHSGPGNMQMKADRRTYSMINNVTLDAQQQSLSPFHPASSLLDLFDTFGPLVFPLYRQALLRKRILLIGQAPVLRACNYVYDLSVLVDIPDSTASLFASFPFSPLRPLFSVGVHDIPYLEELAKNFSKQPSEGQVNELGPTCSNEQGWIACTTDGILASKCAFFDVVVHLPSRGARKDGNRLWPRIESSTGAEIRATQRDFRRYETLRDHFCLHRASTQDQGSTSEDGSNCSDIQGVDTVVEPLSWSALAYTSFMWWASAGERQADEYGESDEETALLDGLDGCSPRVPKRASPDASGDESDGELLDEHAMLPGTAFVAYFRRLTASMLATVADLIEWTSSEGHGEDGDATATEGEATEDARRPLQVHSADISRLGLDAWSAGDLRFVEELTLKYFGKPAVAHGACIECCGVRIC